MVANLSRFPQHVELDLSAAKGQTPVEMFGLSSLPAIGDGPYQLTLGPYAFYWLLLQPAQTSRPPSVHTLEMPTLTVAGVWQNIFEGEAAEQLERILPSYLQTQHWFAGKGDYCLCRKGHYG